MSEIRKLAWIPSIENVEDSITLEEMEPYYLDYYTSTYFENEGQILDAYATEIQNQSTCSTRGKIVIWKDDKNAEGMPIERAITPLYQYHIAKWRYLLTQVQCLKKIEQIDYYNQLRSKEYQRIFKRNEYQILREITNIQDEIQRINYGFVKQCVYTRMIWQDNYYEIVRTLLSKRYKDWNPDIELPTTKNRVSLYQIEEANAIATQKKIGIDVNTKS